jgi:hypothetical protein
MSQPSQNLKTGKMEIIEVLVVSNSLKPPELEKYIYKIFIKRFRNNFDVEIIPVNKIQRKKSGKHKYYKNYI